MAGEKEPLQGLFHHPGESMIITPDRHIPGSVLPLGDALSRWTKERWSQIRKLAKPSVILGGFGGAVVGALTGDLRATLLGAVAGSVIFGAYGYRRDKDFALPPRG